MIRVEIKPRQDNLFDIWVIAANGEVLLNSGQGYENVGDAEAVARKLFGTTSVPIPGPEGSTTGVREAYEPVALRIEFRDGKTHTEQLR